MKLRPWNKRQMQADVPSVRLSQEIPQPAPRSSDWEAIGEAMETMGKIGLALTVGFTAAAVFCRWADQKRLKPSALKQAIQRLT
ncbi:hypothetical protein JST97_04140 [bacterium]|nr:hypothetical protein [bacterium]